MNSSGIRDNRLRGTVADFLAAKIQNGSRLSVVSAYFTIYAYDALREHLDHIEHLDFLFGEPRFISSLDPDKTEKKSFIIDGTGLRPEKVSGTFLIRNLKGKDLIEFSFYLISREKG